MIIHIVAEGETIDSIAELYGVSAERLALENGIFIPVNLAVGETLVILRPEIVYTVQEGDTLDSIAKRYNTSIMELLRNNPYISDQQYIYPGEILVIKYEDVKTGTISTNGYVYPFISMELLRKTLPFLTYISIYSHYYTDTGEVININDMELVRISRDYGVAPIMILSGLVSSPEDQIEVIHNILTSESLQDYLITNLINVLKTKEYYGANITTPYILPEDRNLYVNFIRKFSTRLKEEGYRPFITLTSSAFELLTNVNYGDMQYEILGDMVDNVTIMTYEWGFKYGLPPSIVSFATWGNTISYAISLIDPNKLNLGFSTIGYVWRLPYIEGETVAQAIKFNSAINLAREVDAEIHFDEVTGASYYQYFSDSEYIVRFRDARGLYDVVNLVHLYGVEGVAIWNVMYFLNQLWMIINSQFEIRKLLPVRIIDSNE
jgi:spore germination protein